MLPLLFLACTPSTPAPADDTGADTTDDLHGRFDTVGDRDVLYLWGTRPEMGYAEGALTCDRFVPLFQTYLLDDLLPRLTSFDYGVVRTVVLSTVTFEDDDLAELTAMYQGMVDTCSDAELTLTSDHLEEDTHGSRMIELEDLLFANAVADFGCSSFAAWGDASATGDTVFGRNFDWPIDAASSFVEEHLLKVYDSSDEGARFLSVMVPGFAGCVTCVSEEGVALTMHNVVGLDPTQDDEISPRTLAARAALTATYGADDVVAAAEDALEPRPQMVGNILDLAFPLARGDGETGGVVLEYDGDADHADGPVTVRWPGEDPDLDRTDAIVATNHYMKRTAPDTEGDSYARAVALRTALDAGPVDLDGGKSILAGVENGYGYTTAHAILLDTANRELRLYVAPNANTPAPAAEPVVVDLDTLFGGLP